MATATIDITKTSRVRTGEWVDTPEGRAQVEATAGGQAYLVWMATSRWVTAGELAAWGYNVR